MVSITIRYDPQCLGSELDKDYFKAMTDSDSHVTKITATSSVETGLKRGEAGQGEREKQQNKM